MNFGSHVTNPVNREAFLGIRHCFTQVHFPWTQKNKTLIPYIYNIFQQKNFFKKPQTKNFSNSLLNRLAMASFQLF